jgi:RNA polymerase sigma factor (sigma-70 family)
MEDNTNFTQKASRDFKLVTLIREDNDQKAFVKLMKYYEKSIYFTMLKMTNNPNDAKDLTLEAFEKAHKNIDLYTPTFAFSTWLFKIATNNCIDFLRKEKKSTQSIDLFDEDNELIEQVNSIRTEELNPEENLILEQKNGKMKQIVNKLKPRYKQLIELHYYEDLGYKEIAALLNLPVGTVKAQLFRARNSLQKSLKHLDKLN